MKTYRVSYRYTTTKAKVTKTQSASSNVRAESEDAVKGVLEATHAKHHNGRDIKVVSCLEVAPPTAQSSAADPKLGKRVDALESDVAKLKALLDQARDTQKAQDSELQLLKDLVSESTAPKSSSSAKKS